MKVYAKKLLAVLCIGVITRCSDGQTKEAAVPTPQPPSLMNTISANIACSPDGQLLVTAGHSRDKAVDSPDISDQEMVHGSDRPNPPDLRLWDAKTGTLIRTFDPPEDMLRCIVFSPDGSLLLGSVFRRDSGDVVAWDTATGKQVYLVRAQAHDVFFMPGGQTWIGAGPRLALYDTRTGKETRFLSLQPGLTLNCALSPAEDMLVVAVTEARKGGQAIIWDTHTWQPITRLQISTHAGAWATFLKDGTLLTCGSELEDRRRVVGKLRWWDTHTWSVTKQVNTPPLAGSTTFAASHDRKYGAITGYGSRPVAIVGLEDGVVQWEHSGTRDISVSSVVFWPDGSRLGWGTGPVFNGPDQGVVVRLLEELLNK